MPPSRFCRSTSQPTPRSAASRTCGSPDPTIASATSAPAVSSASGTPPGRSVHAQPPGAAPVYGCSTRHCCPSNQSRRHRRSAGFISAILSPAASASSERVVTHVARLLSTAQLPSARTDRRRNSSPRATTGCPASPAAMRLIATNEVSGIASRKPPPAGCSPSSTSRTRRRARSRNRPSSGPRGPRLCRASPMEISAGRA